MIQVILEKINVRMQSNCVSTSTPCPLRRRKWIQLINFFYHYKEKQMEEKKALEEMYSKNNNGNVNNNNKSNNHNGYDNNFGYDNNGSGSGGNSNRRMYSDLIQQGMAVSPYAYPQNQQQYQEQQAPFNSYPIQQNSGLGMNGQPHVSFSSFFQIPNYACQTVRNPMLDIRNWAKRTKSRKRFGDNIGRNQKERAIRERAR